MKKFLTSMTFVAGLLASSAAFSQTAFVGNEEVTDEDCALLAETVTLGVSANVHGAYLCDEAENLVQVGACHEGGSRSRGAACVDLDVDEPGNQLPEGCTEVGGFSTIPNYIGFVASSEGGVMQEYALGGRCSGDTLSGLEVWGAE